jgi:hypothetical protein
VTPPGTTSTMRPNIAADTTSRAAITVFVATPTMARVATIPSSATAAAATSATAIPIRLRTPSASAAISVAPAAVAATPNHPTRSSRWRSNGRARIAPSTG